METTTKMNRPVFVKMTLGEYLDYLDDAIYVYNKMHEGEIPQEEWDKFAEVIEKNPELTYHSPKYNVEKYAKEVHNG